MIREILVDWWDWSGLRAIWLKFAPDRDINLVRAAHGGSSGDPQEKNWVYPSDFRSVSNEEPVRCANPADIQLGLDWKLARRGATPTAPNSGGPGRRGTPVAPKNRVAAQKAALHRQLGALRKAPPRQDKRSRLCGPKIGTWRACDVVSGPPPRRGVRFRLGEPPPAVPAALRSITVSR